MISEEEFQKAGNKTDEEISQQDLLNLIKSCVRIARGLKSSRNTAQVITNLENAEDKLARVMRGDA